MSDCFLIPYVGTCLGTQNNRLIEMILLSTKTNAFVDRPENKFEVCPLVLRPNTRTYYANWCAAQRMCCTISCAYKYD